MKTLIIIVLTLFCGTASAQRISDYVQKLRAPNGEKNAFIQITTDSKSNSAINASSPVEDKVPGFRVCIFFDNSQAARQAATATQSQLSSLHPGLSHYLVYTNPVWKVMAGDCLTRAEATHLMGRLRTNFPKAFIVNESIPIKNVINTPISSNTDETVVE